MSRDLIIRRLRRSPVLLLALILLGPPLGTSSAALAAEDISKLFLDGTPILDMRYRFENVDQDGIAADADAHTLRTRLGFETGKVKRLGLGFDVEWTQPLGSDKFNSTTNGKTQFPTVADPRDFALNRLYFVADGTIPETSLKVGRQRIIWDNARFIGNVGFRQNEQTFNALRLGTTALPDAEIDYAYLEEAYRIFGSRSSVGELEMNSHAIRLRYSGLQFATLTPFAVLLDFDRTDQAANSSASVGLALSGKQAINQDWTFKYAASAVHQGDHADNPADYSLWYVLAEPQIAYRRTALKLGYELLQGDGSNSFRTPLATGHAFNGLTDKFLTTPANGLQDVYLKLDTKLSPAPWLSDLTIKAAFHDFHADNGGAHYGREWNLGAFKAFKSDYGAFLLGLQYADYNADEFATDTGKFWLTLQFKLSPEPYRARMQASQEK